MACLKPTSILRKLFLAMALVFSAQQGNAGTVICGHQSSYIVTDAWACLGQATDCWCKVCCQWWAPTDVLAEWCDQVNGSSPCEPGTTQDGGGAAPKKPREEQDIRS